MSGSRGARRRLRIVLVEFLPAGGLFQFTFQLVEALADLGHDVELLTGRDPEMRTGSSLRVREILPTWTPGTGEGHRWRTQLRRVGRALRYGESWRRVASYVGAAGFDVVLWSDMHFAIDGFVVSWMAGRPGAPVMASIAHTPVPYTETRSGGGLHRDRGPMAWSLRRVMSRLDCVFVLGKRSRDQLRESWPSVRRVEVIPHGNEDFYLDDAEPGTVTAPGECGPSVLFFGNWDRYKGIDVLLEAWAEVKQRRPDAELVMAGTPAKTIDVVALTAEARALAVDLRPGYVPVDDVARLFGAARAVVAPYTFANQSGVVHLAQTFGRPVVVTDTGDLAAAVQDGSTGFVVPTSDAHAVADALVRLLDDAGLATRMGDAGRERLERESSWQVVAERVSTVLCELRRGDASGSA